ncbi:MAG: DUF4115 domain-containing protein, partial [Proteobacteria bacterium]|nr:DUF4115 domain-containing protein [Pseudomonadota bacterium]
SILERNALEAPHDPDAAAQGAVAGERVRRITAQGSDHLVMKFSEDCWVEINATDGAPLFNDLGHTGQTLRLIGDAPFRILLGYAPGVTMAFNDEAVPLRPHTRNNVATLVVGQ